MKKKELFAVYARDYDITFIMEETTNKAGDLISTECVGFYYGEPTEADTKYFKGKLKAKFDWRD